LTPLSENGRPRSEDIQKGSNDKIEAQQADGGTGAYPQPLASLMGGAALQELSHRGRRTPRDGDGDGDAVADPELSSLILVLPDIDKEDGGSAANESKSFQYRAGTSSHVERRCFVAPAFTARSFNPKSTGPKDMAKPSSSVVGLPYLLRRLISGWRSCRGEENDCP
jgi:hypothetical protein